MSREHFAADRPDRSTGPILWCVIAAALFGASTPASKPLIDQLGPNSLRRRRGGRRSLGAARARSASWSRQEEHRTLLGAVLFGGVVGPVLLLSGLALAPAGSVSLWLNLETVATAVLARVFFREHLGARTRLITSTILNMFVVPALMLRFGSVSTISNRARFRRDSVAVLMGACSGTWSSRSAIAISS